MIFRISCIITAIAIGLNALGAHALSNSLTPNQLSIFETASRYLLMGGMWLMILKKPDRNLPKSSIYLILLGLTVFCGSLFLYLLFSAKIIMIATPFGGIMLMLGFILLGINKKYT